MNSLIDVAVMVLYGSMLVLKFGTSKGPPSPYPSLHFSSTASRGWHCHSHMQGHTKKLPHTLLVKIEIAIPFRKQSGSIYPKSRPPSLMKSSHVPMTTALSGTESFSWWYRGRPRTSTSHTTEVKARSGLTHRAPKSQKHSIGRQITIFKVIL